MSLQQRPVPERTLRIHTANSATYTRPLQNLPEPTRTYQNLLETTRNHQNPSEPYELIGFTGLQSRRPYAPYELLPEPTRTYKKPPETTTTQQNHMKIGRPHV